MYLIILLFTTLLRTQSLSSSKSHPLPHGSSKIFNCVTTQEDCFIVVVVIIVIVVVTVHIVVSVVVAIIFGPRNLTLKFSKNGVPNS